MDDATLKSEIARTWTAGSGDYDRHTSHGIHTPEEEEAWIAAFNAVLPKGNLHVLDVGCGTGAMGLLLAKQGHTVSGADLSEGMLAVGRKKAEEAGLSMTFEVGDAENPPFSDGMFDAVVNRHLLWTLPHPVLALENWFRVLKPSGTLIVIDGLWDDGSGFSHFRRAVSEGIAKRRDEHPHGSHRYSNSLSAALPNRGGLPAGRVAGMFREAGFSDVSVHELHDILQIQQKSLHWYEKLAPKSAYYLVSGRKQGVINENEP